MAVVGSALAFGVPNDELSLTTQKLTWSKKIDMKEARDKTGKVVSVCFYNETNEVKVDGMGTYSGTLGASVSLTSFNMVGGTQYLTDISLDYSAEDFVKTSATIKSWEGIN